MQFGLEEVKKIVSTGDYKRIPIYRELYADRFTPIEVMRTLRAASRHCYLLESAEKNDQWGRYSFLGYAPSLELTCTDGIRIRPHHKSFPGHKTGGCDVGHAKQCGLSPLRSRKRGNRNSV